MKKKFSKKVTALTLSAVMVLSTASCCAASAETESSVESAEEQVVSGVTREYAISEFVQSVGRALMQGNTAVLGFLEDSDEISPEYVEDIAKAVTCGLVSAADGRLLKPGDALTRAEAYALFARAITLPVNGTEKEEIEEIDPASVVLPSDTPEWAQNEIALLIAYNLITLGEDGLLHGSEPVSEEEFGSLIAKADDILAGCTVGESFYGYVNGKTFRNVELSKAPTVDVKHGAVIQEIDYWASYKDLLEEIEVQEKDYLERLMAGEIPFEQGTPEQRIHDMLELYESYENGNQDDFLFNALVDGWRAAIKNAGTIEELMNASLTICEQSGFNPMFDLDCGMGGRDNNMVPTIRYFEEVASGTGVINYRSFTADRFAERYKEAIAGFAEAAGLELTEDDVERYYELETVLSSEANYAPHIISMLRMMSAFDERIDVEAEIDLILAEHPELDEDGELTCDPGKIVSIEEADELASVVKPAELLTTIGFHDFDQIKFVYGDLMERDSELLTEENLPVLKLRVFMNLCFRLNAYRGEENDRMQEVMNIATEALTMTSADAAAADAAESVSSDVEDMEEPLGGDIEMPPLGGGESDQEGMISEEALSFIRDQFPMDIGTIYATKLMDESIYEDVEEIVKKVCDAYRVRFEQNTWMSDETKQEAINKLDHIEYVIGYPRNEINPEIVSMADGGTFYSNMIRIFQSELAAKINACDLDARYMKKMMVEPPDTFNAMYMPELNIVNVFAAILNPPYYDPEATEAENLGTIGYVIAHEIGHAFDNRGSMYDENGEERNWWTPEDREYYDSLTEHFVEYYSNFEAVEGVVQDSSITIGENMADFAGLTIVMDVLADDPEAQKEALIANAKVQAVIGTPEYLTQNITDVHSTNNVRVDANVASLDVFYDLFCISEDDPMYIAPEDRLTLW